jgi:hypothetical protein
MKKGIFKFVKQQQFTNWHSPPKKFVDSQSDVDRDMTHHGNI